MSEKPKYFIGIDPDVDASGVCAWDAEARAICKLTCMRFPELLEFLRHMSKTQGGKTHVVIDAGWLNRANFHARGAESQRVNAKIGERTGANHEVGKKIGEMCVYYGLSCEFHRPTRSKVDAEYFTVVTGWTGRTNQEHRDAAMLVHGK